MDVRLLIVPYDSGQRGERMGRGPHTLLQRGLDTMLRVRGHAITVEHIESDSGVRAEIATSFELITKLAARMKETADAGIFPLVLAGNCSTSVGTIAGLRDEDTGVIWFDAHGDFNTPETTESGFLDGMALAMLTGRCWPTIAARVSGFRAVPEETVILVGARDFDSAESIAIRSSAMTVVSPQAVREKGAASALGSPLASLRSRRLYVHVDLDVLDSGEARANSFSSQGGLSTAEVISAIRAIGDRHRISAGALTAYDPSFDPDARAQRAAFDIIAALVETAAGSREN